MLPNGLETVYEYNDANWVTPMEIHPEVNRSTGKCEDRLPKGAGTGCRSGGAADQTATPTNVLQSFQYGYDKVGNRTWVKYKTGSGDVYKYDETYQLVGVKYGVSNPEDGYDLAVATTREVTYGYDALGNRLRVTDEATMTDYYANNLNQYTQVGANTDFTYDTNGNLTGDGTWTFGYDREAHLISASKSGTSVTYQYDTLGRRIAKNVNGTITNFVYSGQDLIEERDATNAVTAKYVYAGGIDNPVKVIKGANTYYYQQDALGNVTALTDSSGAIFETYTYDAFGKPKIKDGSGATMSTSSQPFLFTGREFDVETGLYHYRARAYSPELGRFMQVDMLGIEADLVNFYRYVANRPVRFVDPWGWCAENPNTPSVDDLGIEGSLDALDKSVNDPEEREFCGMICEKCEDGKKVRFRTPAVPGNRKQCWPWQSPCPSGSDEIGAYHNHPNHGRGPLSPQDHELSRRLSLKNGRTCPVYMGRHPRSSDPNAREVQKTTGSAGSATTIF